MREWVIAIAVAIVYLIISFTLRAWAWSWIIWAAYAGYRFWENSSRGRQV